VKVICVPFFTFLHFEQPKATYSQTTIVQNMYIVNGFKYTVSSANVMQYAFPPPLLPFQTINPAPRTGVNMQTGLKKKRCERSDFLGLRNVCK